MSFLHTLLVLAVVTMTGFTLAASANDARRATQDMIEGTPTR